MEPHVKWKNVLEDFSKYQLNSYHKNAVVWGEISLATVSRLKSSILEVLNTQKRDEIEINRKRFRLIIEIIPLY